MKDKVSIGALRFNMTTQELRDSWWLNCDGITVKQPMSLNAVERQYQSNPDAVYQILHADETSAKSPKWRQLEGRLRPPPRNSRSPIKLPKPAAFEENDAEPENIVAPSPLTPKVMARLDEIEATQRETMSMLREVCAIVQEMGLHLASSESIRERERFVNEAEDRLVDEAHRIEEERAEIEQMRAELNRGNLKVVGA